MAEVCITKTWRDIEEAALTDPILHAALHYQRAGALTREQSLIAAIFALKAVNDMHRNELLRIHMHAPSNWFDVR